MKKLKLSRTSWLILSVGLFAVIMIGLGLTRSQQIGSQSRLDEELSVAEMRLDKLQVQVLHQQLAELQGSFDQSETQLIAAKDKLRQTVESIDVTDKFFAIAKSCNVEVKGISSSGIKSEKLGGVVCAAIMLNAEVAGKVSDLINFVTRLNNDFSTGLVNSAQISIPNTDDMTQPLVRIMMVVYSYKGD